MNNNNNRTRNFTFSNIAWLLTLYVFSLLFVFYRFHQVTVQKEDVLRIKKDSHSGNLMRYWSNVLYTLCQDDVQYSLNKIVCSDQTISLLLKGLVEMQQSTNNTRRPSICNAEQLGTTTCEILVFESSNDLVTLDWYNIHEVVDEISSAYCRLRSEYPRSLIAYELKVPDSWLKDYNSSILEFEIQVTFFYLLLRLISSLQLPVLFQVENEPLNRKLSSIFMERIYNQWNNTRSNLLPTCSSTNLFHLCGKYINTRKYHPHCFPPPLKLYPVLVTGLGGSGTHFITRELNALGFHLSHESIADQGSVVRLFF